MKFITRSVFIRTLGIRYLGINGLFTNILTLLSLAELGLDSAIIFRLYKPIINKDQKQILLLMTFFRQAYRYVGLIIGLIGLLLMPFIPIIITDDVSFVNIELVFIIYLFQNLTTYFMYAYKSAIIKAHQKEYVLSAIDTVINIFISLIQITILLLYDNFIMYLFTVVIFNIIKNLTIALYANKQFPFIVEHTNIKLNKSEIRDIFKDCFALFLHKINVVVLNATDNIILSIFIGLEVVGLYSNYILILTALKTILKKFYTSISAGIGHLYASEDIDHLQFVFKVANLFTIFIYGVTGLGIYFAGNSFIGIWLGKDYVIPGNFVLLLAIEMYIFGLQRNLATFRTSMGLFEQAKYRPLFGIVINLGISVVLVKHLGICGVLIGTIISSLVTYMWFDPYIIYKFGFKKSVKKYYLKNFEYLLFILINGIIIKIFLNFINYEGLKYFLVAGFTSVTIPVMLLIVVYGKSDEAKYIKDILKKLIIKIKIR